MVMRKPSLSINLLSRVDYDVAWRQRFGMCFFWHVLYIKSLCCLRVSFSPTRTCNFSRISLDPRLNYHQPGTTECKRSCTPVDGHDVRIERNDDEVQFVCSFVFSDSSVNIIIIIIIIIIIRQLRLINTYHHRVFLLHWTVLGPYCCSIFLSRQSLSRWKWNNTVRFRSSFVRVNWCYSTIESSLLLLWNGRFIRTRVRIERTIFDSIHASCYRYFLFRGTDLALYCSLFLSEI